MAIPLGSALCLLRLCFCLHKHLYRALQHVEVQINNTPLCENFHAQEFWLSNQGAQTNTVQAGPSLT